MTDTASPDSGASAATDDGMVGISGTEYWAQLRGDESTAVEEPQPEGEQTEAATEDSGEPEEARDEGSEPPTDETEQTEQQGHKPPRGVQKRLNELTRERHEAERRAQATEAQLGQALELIQRMLDKGQQPQQPQPKAKDLAVEAPDPQDYFVNGNFDALTYNRDLIEHLTEQKVSARLEAERQAREKAEAERARDEASREFRAKVAQAAEAIPDYREVMDGARDHPFFSSEVSAHVASDPNGPELAYVLAREPALMDQLARMPPAQALMQMGRVSAWIDSRRQQAASQATAPKASKAPPPPTPVGRASANTDSGYLGRTDLSQASWESRREAELKQSGKRRF